MSQDSSLVIHQQSCDLSGQLSYIQAAGTARYRLCKTIDKNCNKLVNYQGGSEFAFYNTDFYSWFGNEDSPGLKQILDTFYNTQLYCPILGRAKEAYVSRGQDENFYPRLLNDRSYQEATITSEPIIVFIMDIDGFAVSGINPIDDSEQCAREVVEKLGPDFEDVTFWYCFTSGQKPEPEVNSELLLRIRLVFLLNDAVSLEDMAHWVQQPKYIALKLDSALYNPIQPIFIAPPIVVDGPDPLPQRSGFIQGNKECVTLKIPPRVQEKNTTRVKPHLNNVSATIRISAGIDTDHIDDLLSLIGDHEGGMGAYQAFRYVTMLLVIKHGDKLSNEAMIKLVRDQAKKAKWVDPTHTPQYLMEKLSDYSLENLINGARAKVNFSNKLYWDVVQEYDMSSCTDEPSKLMDILENITSYSSRRPTHD